MVHSKDIPFFRGVFMRDKLPKKSKSIECGIVNLDLSKNNGTHWVAYIKIKDSCEYFDSYGNLKPPVELINYLRSKNIYYNYTTYQRFNSTNCGHLCLSYLKKFWRNYLK